MEPIQGKHASKFAPQDFISNMPDIAITNIMDRLPIQDAVRTGILASNWRYKWTMLSQLVLDDSFFGYLFKRNIKDNHTRIISRILLHLRGAITKFVLSIHDSVLDAEDINHWILFLSRKGIKDLTLKYTDETTFELPSHLFSCLELKHLELYNCEFEPPYRFRGFPNLLSLELDLPDEGADLSEFLSGCPLLEILNLRYEDCIGHVKLVVIAKLVNLKILSLSSCDLVPEITSSSTIFELLGSLPKLKQLHLDFLDYVFTEVGAKKRFPANFPCLKALKLSNIDLESDAMLSCFIEVVRSFPNMQTLEITARCTSSKPVCFPEIDYSTMGLLQLQNVVVTKVKASENEVCLIKYLLACSPILKKVVIRSGYPLLSSDAKLMFAMKLLKLYRASPLVDFDLSYN